jgi:4-hydroxy-tetrahydrodipicolinate synthase
VLGELLTAIVTPFHADGRVDFDGFRRLAAHLVDNGSDGLVVTGTTGESPTLTDEEKIELWKAAVDEVGERATVVAGTGTYSTAHSVELTDKAHDLGVDGFLVVTPYYNKPPQAGIVEHFRAIGEVSDKPIIAYNIPARVVVNIEPATIAELAEEVPTVRAVKQSNADLDQARRIREETDLDLYCGDDPLLATFLELGAVGGVSVRGNIAGRQMKEMIRRFREGDTDGGRRLDDELRPLWELDDVAVNPIPIKAALNMLGWEVGGHRLPLVEATPEQAMQIRSCLERAGLQVATPA